MAILQLTLMEIPFIIMLNGAKPDEFRPDCKWIASRVDGRTYSHVKFTNGYGADKPWFIAEYKGYSIAEEYETRTFTFDSLFITVYLRPYDYILHLGKVVESGNIKSHTPALSKGQGDKKQN